MSDNHELAKYDPVLIFFYFHHLPLWRKILSRFFKRYKIRKEEYDEWFKEVFLVSEELK